MGATGAAERGTEASVRDRRVLKSHLPSATASSMTMFPQDLKYAESHEWAKVDGPIVTVGISGYAVQELTDLTYLELPEVGDSLEAGKTFGVIESVKATSDLYAPVSGEVTEVNEDLPGNLDTFGEDPYGAAWMIKLQATSLDEDLRALLSAEDYAQRLSEE